MRLSESIADDRPLAQVHAFLTAYRRRLSSLRARLPRSLLSANGSTAIYTQQSDKDDLCVQMFPDGIIPDHIVLSKSRTLDTDLKIPRQYCRRILQDERAIMSMLQLTQARIGCSSKELVSVAKARAALAAVWAKLVYFPVVDITSLGRFESTCQVQTNIPYPSRWQAWRW